MENIITKIIDWGDTEIVLLRLFTFWTPALTHIPCATLPTPTETFENEFYKVLNLSLCFFECQNLSGVVNIDYESNGLSASFYETDFNLINKKILETVAEIRLDRFILWYL